MRSLAGKPDPLAQLGVWSRFAVAGLPPHPWAATSHSRSRYSPAFPDPRLGRRQWPDMQSTWSKARAPDIRLRRAMTFGRRHPRCDGAQIAPFGRDSDCHAGDRTAVQKWRLRARHAADRVISVFSQAGNAEDTEGMDGKRAEAYLRFRAEAELRRAAAQPWDSAVADGCAARVMRVARVLTAVHALEAEVADQILDDFELALGARQTGSAGQRGAGLRSLMATPPSARRRREVLMNSPPSAAGGSTAVAVGQAHAPGSAGLRAASCRVVPVGQLIPVCGSDGRGEIYVLSYLHTAVGARFTMAVQGCRPSWRLPFHQFTAADEQGASYQMGTHCSGGGPRDWALRLHPDPLAVAQWGHLGLTKPICWAIERPAAGAQI
jgi:hypothetical protein